MKHIRLLMLLLTVLVTAAGCSKHDDIGDIFASGKAWHWSSSYNTSNWNDDNNFSESLTSDERKQINSEADSYTVLFLSDGTLKGQGKNFTFTGTWTAEADGRTVGIRLTTAQNSSGLDRKFYDELSQARFYRGDSRTLKLFDDTRKHFIQFYHWEEVNTRN